jgi:Zn-dependent metalloprotease
MARKAKKARSSRTIAARPAHGFQILAMHVTAERDRRAFEALRADRPASNTFALRESLPKNLDPESAAKRILAHAFASRAMPSLNAPKVHDEECDFRSLGVETVPLTGTTVVKFRQQIEGIPVFGSLVSVELDDHNELVSLNSSLAKPDLASYVARISPRDALKRIAARAGYGGKLPDGVPALNLFLDHMGKWHLAYIVEDVRSRNKGKGNASKGHHQIPLVFDYVIDARNGALVAELPRTPAARHGTASAADELGRMKTFNIETRGGKRVMRDAILNIETCDFGYRDPVGGKLPGNLAASPWSPAAVSAHTHAATVTTFLRRVLKRNNIDNMGGRVVSTVNCVVKQFEKPPGSKVWLNAFWDGIQMLYGQEQLDDGQLRSMASSLSVVAHELFHGVTGATARLVYLGETGALNESYSDIFGTLIANDARPNIAKWNWEVGCGVAIRNMQDPTLHNQPKLMKHFINAPLTPNDDSGAVHFNSGIHNYAAYHVMSAKAGRKFIFRPHELAAMFYVALTQQLSRQSTFADSRRGVVLATRSLFRKLPGKQIERRVAAVEAGFDAAGIR